LYQLDATFIFNAKCECTTLSILSVHNFQLTTDKAEARKQTISFERLNM